MVLMLKKGLFFFSACLVGFFFLAGCVLTMPDPLLQKRDPGAGIIPVLKGKWRDSEGATLTIKPTSFPNTFTLESTSRDGDLTVTMERLNESHYILQVEPKDSQGVFLTVGEVTEKRINVYLYPEALDDIRKLGDKHGITITENGLITGYKDSKEVVAFFRELAFLPNHEIFDITKM
jgi:hypothetical protein